MPQMEVVPYKNPGNVEVLNYIRGIASNDYQNRVPAATKANIDDAIESMWNYTPARNQFQDALVNLIGAQILRNNTWTNPLAKFKQGQMANGETIEEVQVGLLKARSYNFDADALEREIFGRENNEVQSRWHKIDRQDRYKLSVSRLALRRAFLSPNGISDFISKLMQQITTSDNWDEFLITCNLFRKYYEEDGFFKVNVPSLSNAQAGSNEAKYFLRTIREYTDTLPFISRQYNAAKMPVSAQPEQLELFMTPRGKAVLDVDGLAAAFNIDKANVSSRITVIPDERFDIPGVQGILTTREFFLIMDQFMDMQEMNNPAGVYTNYWWHHHELISASPFAPAIMFTSGEADTVVIIDYQIDGINDYTVTDLYTQGAVANSTVSRGGAYLVATTAITSPAGGPNNGVTLSVIGARSGKTRITQNGVLIIGQDEPSTTITVHGTATDDHTFQKDIVLTVTGSLLSGSVGQQIDDDQTAISNRHLPIVQPDNGAQEGTRLTVTNGEWDTEGLTFAYQWRRGTTDISGATDNQYIAVAADRGQAISARVTATKGAATKAATSRSVTVAA